MVARSRDNYEARHGQKIGASHRYRADGVSERQEDKKPRNLLRPSKPISALQPVNNYNSKEKLACILKPPPRLPPRQYSQLKGSSHEPKRGVGRYINSSDREVSQPVELPSHKKSDVSRIRLPSCSPKREYSVIYDLNGRAYRNNKYDKNRDPLAHSPYMGDQRKHDPLLLLQRNKSRNHQRVSDKEQKSDNREDGTEVNEKKPSKSERPKVEAPGISIRPNLPRYKKLPSVERGPKPAQKVYPNPSRPGNHSLDIDRPRYHPGGALPGSRPSNQRNHSVEPSRPLNHPVSLARGMEYPSSGGENSFQPIHRPNYYIRLPDRHNPSYKQPDWWG